MIPLLSITLNIILIYTLCRYMTRVKHLQAQSDKQFESILELSKEMRKDYPIMSNYAWEMRKRRILQALNRNTYTGK